MLDPRRRFGGDDSGPVHPGEQTRRLGIEGLRGLAGNSSQSSAGMSRYGLRSPARTGASITLPAGG